VTASRWLPRTRRRLRDLMLMAVLSTVGVIAAGYVLYMERAPNPFQSTYSIHVALTAADGVQPGLGQPVDVVGVGVGQISGVQLHDGLALLTLSIERSKLRHVYADATATLAPITPLGDLELDLSPGRPPARVLPPGGTLGAGQTSSPGSLTDLLDALNTDTRAYVSSLIQSMGDGTHGRAPDIHSLLTALGPTTAQVRQIAVALHARRQDLAALVHNLSGVMRAAADNGQVSDLIASGDKTLKALASQDTALGQSVNELPSTLATARSTLANLQAFDGELAPTLSALLPAIHRLPQTVSDLQSFARSATPIVRTKIRPFVRAAQPLLARLRPAVSDISATDPDLLTSVKILRYTTNELAYNGGSSQPGMLFWLDWVAHNWNNIMAQGDAHGNIGRAELYVTCPSIAKLGSLGMLLAGISDTLSICPGAF
jgi:phospholipid/cholesterol/gamma-HCH transport system substrate-binding protein